MGDYVYALRSPKNCRTTVVDVNGEEKVLFIASMSYLFKPSTMRSNKGEEQSYWNIVSRLINIWEKSGVRVPLYAAITSSKNHKIEDGQPVYGFNEAMFSLSDGWGTVQACAPYSYNDGKISGWFVYGTVKKVLK